MSSTPSSWLFSWNTSLYWLCTKIGKSAKIETFSKIFDFLHRLKALNERISEWAHFLNLAKGSTDIWILGFFFTRQDLGTLHYLEWHQKKIFDGFFFNFLEINTHNFFINDPKFESKGLFHAKCYGAWHEKTLDPKAMAFWVWDLCDAMV